MYKLGSINNDYNGFQQLINLYEILKDTDFEDIDIDISDFFAANMCAPFGSLLEGMRLRINDLHLNIKKPSTKAILQKNGFLCDYGYDELDDSNHTTIRYRKFGRNEVKLFSKIVKYKVIPREGMPMMSDKLKKMIESCISEIFVNASMHTESPYIFACGQFFPKRHELHFTIADMGSGGIKERVNTFLNKNLSATEAIKWALIDGNTTKTDAPGGYGLSLLKNLIELNKGLMQIVSNDGFYQYQTEENYKSLQGEFPGTVVNLRFRTNDTASYKLKDE